VRKQSVLIVLIICLLGMAVSAFVYIQEQKTANALFAGEISVNTLQRLVAQNESFIVYFYGRSCEDCAISEPILIEAVRLTRDSANWPPGLPIYRCERDANATVRGLYGVEQTPTLIYFSLGKEQARQEGPLPGIDEYGAFFSRLK